MARLDTKKLILELAGKGPVRSSDIVSKTGISRQTVTSHLATLVAAGRLVRTGSTRAAVYRLAGKGRPESSGTKAIALVKKLKGLEEDRVFREVEARLGLKRRVNQNCLAVLAYAFTEMLNNAIDHSRSDRTHINVRVDQKFVHFRIRDQGIGIFHNVKTAFHLEDELVALEHLFKGKQTTDPKNHSGEGIFFTSRIADVFTLRSHEWNARVDNRVQDTFISEMRFIKGTEVEFTIARQTKKKLPDLFARFSDDEFRFDKNEVRLKISQANGALSRSQAKRLLIGLDKFQRIVLDFTGIKEVGQGFVDEVFRIYAVAHPDVLLTHANASRAVEFMIQRAQRRSGA